MRTLVFHTTPGCHLNAQVATRSALRPNVGTLPVLRMVSVRAETNPSDMLSEAEKFMQDVIEDSPSAATAPLNISPSDLLSQRDQAVKQVRQTPLLEHFPTSSPTVLCQIKKKASFSLIFSIKMNRR